MDVASKAGYGKGTHLQSSQPEQGFLRHITACNNARQPGRRVAFRIGADQVGWVLPEIAEALAGFADIVATADGVMLTRPEALLAINRELADRGLLRWRREAFDVRARPDGPVLAQVDRGALPVLGIAAVGVHVNGLVGDIADPKRLQLWVARRAADKALDPGKFDNIVAGGVPAGFGTVGTLIKEAEEEAAIQADLAVQANEVAVLSYAMERPEGLRRDRLHCFDLFLPEAFTPHPVDGEVSGFELWPLPRVLEAVRDTEAFKFNVNLVLIDLFLRLGLIADARAVRTALDAAR